MGRGAQLCPQVPCRGLNLPCDPPPPHLCRRAASTSPTRLRRVRCGCSCCSTLPRRKYSWASSPTTRAASSTASGKWSPTTSRSSSTERWVGRGGGARGAVGREGRFNLWGGWGDNEEELLRCAGELRYFVWSIKLNCYRFIFYIPARRLQSSCFSED